MNNLMTGGLAKICGEKAGCVVEGMVEKCMGGDKKTEDDGHSGESGIMDQITDLAGGKKEDDGVLDNVMSLLGSKKEEESGGGGAADAIQGAMSFFK